MKNTINYNFNLPEQTDFYNIDDINTNFNKLDTDLKQIDDVTKSTVASEAGAHGLRYFKNNLEYYDYDGENWTAIVNHGGYKVYGVVIDTLNSNPETAVTYTDDAIGMTAGSAEWDKTSIFSKIKPCVLKNGKVNYYLNPNDYTKKADGTPADITTGADGDVMVEIPKLAYLIYSDDRYVYVKVTDHPYAKMIDNRFAYYAHTRDVEGDRNNLYIGAYLAFNDNGKLRSLSGKTPTVKQTFTAFRTQAQANGAGYDQVSFYPLTLMQCLYLIRFKNLDSQTAIGLGAVNSGPTSTNTGGANERGLWFGETTGKQQLKCLGVEDFWGNLWTIIDGVVLNETYNLLTNTKNFNNTGDAYIDNGQIVTSDFSGWVSKTQSTSLTGFLAKETIGSATTYYSDHVDVRVATYPRFGGYYSSMTAGGIFALQFNLGIAAGSSSSSNYIGSRLMYL